MVIPDHQDRRKGARGYLENLTSVDGRGGWQAAAHGSYDGALEEADGLKRKRIPMWGIVMEDGGG